MSEELEARFRISLDGKDELSDFFRQSEAGANKLGSSLSKSLGQAGEAISGLAGKVKSSLGDFAGKEIGGSIGSHARGVLELRDAINKLAVSSGKGGEIVGELKDQIQSVSKASNQLQGDVTEALQAFVERTGDLDTARRNLAAYAKVATATSSSLSDIAQVGVDLKEKLDISDQAKSFAILASMAKAGAIELRDLAKVGPRIFNVAESAGVTGEAGLRDVGALAEVYAKGVGGSGSSRSARVATAIENTFASISKKAAKLEANGIKVEGRDRFDVLFDIIRRTKGNETQLREVFTQQAMRGIMVLANEYKRTGSFDTFKQFRDINPDANLIERDFATRMSTGSAKLKSEEIRRNSFFDKYLGGAAEFGAAHATELQAAQYGLSGLGYGLKLAGRLGGRGGAILGGAGGVLSDVTAQRVFVVNWPAGGLGGSPGAPGASQAECGGGGLLASAWEYGKYAVPIGALVTAGTAAVAYAGDREDLVDKLSRGTQERDAATMARREESRASIVRRSGGAVIAAPGRSLGNLDQVMSVTADREDLVDKLSRGTQERDAATMARREESRASIVRRSGGAVIAAPGRSLGNLDQVMSVTAEVKNLTVVINGDEAHAETDTGTRSPKVMVRRGAQ